MTKRALVVGTNYPGTSFQLAGCVNDAKDWEAAFMARGFDAIVTLLDKEASKANILADLSDALGVLESGDLLVFTFSGHGTWRPGGADEPRDECICPNDLKQAGVIADDDLFELFTTRKRGVRVVMVADSCYSGTINRLVSPLADDGRRVRFLSPAEWMAPAELSGLTAKLDTTYRGELSARSLGTGALVAAGCGPTQVCYDASFNNRPNGAFTYVALKALGELPNVEVNYRAWMRAIRTYLPSVDFDQKPQLDGSSYQKGWTILDDSKEG
jgi:uncharacterized caspase-like protein